MNTTTDTPKKTLAPFAAKIEFKPNNLWQGIHQRWTFRSDYFVELNAPPKKQFFVLENFILKDLKGTYFQASIFDNRLKNYSDPARTQFEKSNNLILQVYNDFIKIDKRKDLDLSWMEPTFDTNFLNFLSENFTEAKYINDLKANHLTEHLKFYKQTIQNL